MGDGTLVGATGTWESRLSNWAQPPRREWRIGPHISCLGSVGTARGWRPWAILSRSIVVPTSLPLSAPPAHAYERAINQRGESVRYAATQTGTGAGSPCDY